MSSQFNRWRIASEGVIRGDDGSAQKMSTEEAEQRINEFEGYQFYPGMLVELVLSAQYALAYCRLREKALGDDYQNSMARKVEDSLETVLKKLGAQ